MKSLYGIFNVKECAAELGKITKTIDYLKSNFRIYWPFWSGFLALMYILACSRFDLESEMYYGPGRVFRNVKINAMVKVAVEIHGLLNVIG